MKKFNILLIFVFSFISKVDANDSNIFEEKYAELYIKSLAAISDFERESDQKKSTFLKFFDDLLIPRAYGETDKYCMISGWMGKVVDRTCSVLSNKFLQYKNTCHSSGYQNSVPCNPTFFPGSPICIPQSSSSSTSQCLSKYLNKMGISKPINSLNSEDLKKIGQELIKKKVDLNKVVSLANSSCNFLTDKSLNQYECKQIHKLFQKLVTTSTPQQRQIVFPMDHTPPRMKNTMTTFELKSKKTKSECSTLDRNDPNEPVYDQGQTGSCYAFAAVQIMNHKNPFKVSAYATAAYHHYFTGRADLSKSMYDIIGFDGGTIENALKAANNYGPCLEGEYRSGSSMDQIYLSLKKEFEDYRNKIETQGLQCAELPGLKNQIIDDMINLHGDLLTRLNDNEKNKDNLEKILNRSKTLDDFFFNMTNYACNLRPPNPKMCKILPCGSIDFEEIGIETAEDEQKAIDALHKTLESGDIQGISYFTDNLIKTPGDRHGRHASVVVGRNYLEDTSLLNGKPPGCYFLVKNSWGVGWPKGGKINNPLKAIGDPKRPGFFWVSEKDLANNLTKYTHVDKSRK